MFFSMAMSDPGSKKQGRNEQHFLIFFFSFLNKEAANRYLVIRNYETLPTTVSGSDIDIIVTSVDFKALIAKLEAEAGEVGYRKWKKYRKNFSMVQVSFVPEVCNDPKDIVRLDFIKENMKWLGFDLVDRRILWSNRIEKNCISVLGEPAKTVLTLMNTFLYGGKLKEKYLREYRNLKGEDRQYVDKCILGSFRGYGNLVIDKLEHGSIDEIHNQEMAKIRLGFLKARRFEPRSLLNGVAGWLRTGFSRAIDPPGLFIALIGPDGCGKSTLSEMLGRKCKRMFPGISHFHLFPKLKLFGFLDRVSRDRWEKRHEKTTEWEQRNRKHSVSRSLMRCLYLLMRFWAGYWLWVYPRLAKGHLIIGERWSYDILFDPASKGIRLPEWFRKIIFWLCPEPQKIIVLWGDAQKIANRKEDLPREEIERQISLIRGELGEENGRVFFVDGTAGVEKTFSAALQSICRW